MILCSYAFICVYLLCPQQFGKEILADERGDLKYDKIHKILESASGAAYGTGK